MKTIEIEIYTFEELSEQAKETARAWWRNGDDFPYFGEMAQSLKAFCDHYGVKLVDYTLSDCYRAHIDTDASPRSFRGLALKQVQGNAQLMPTGVFYDCRLFEGFADSFKKSGDALDAFKETLEDYLRMVREEIEYYYSDENIDEMLIVNEYDFTEDGKLFVRGRA